MPKLLNATKANLLAGLRLATFQSCELSRFVITGEQLLVLIGLEFLLSLVLDYFRALPEPSFNVFALPTFSFSQAIAYLTLFIVLSAWKKTGLFLTLAVVTASISPIISLIDWVSDSFGKHWWVVPLGIYALVLMTWSAYFALARAKQLTTVVIVALFLTAVPQVFLFGEYQDFWYPAEPERTAQSQETWLEYQNMDSEKLMYNQPNLLVSALRELKPQREKVSDLFFVGFASYAREDVFMKEVIFAKELLDRRFGTEGHSVNLINHLSTRDTVPLANATNLAVTLKQIGKVMDKEEDVLMLYLTSHGSKEHELAVSFWPLPLNDITPEKLRLMLDQAGIKWRVIVVSACYSGGFIKALANDHTVVATAAAADKTSFGCGTESEFTYFGEALFKDLLSHDQHLLSALDEAGSLIGKREQRENISASLPQMSVGHAIKTKLDGMGMGTKTPPKQCNEWGKRVNC